MAAINRDVTTGVDTSGKIANNFDLKSAQATLAVTTAFMQAAAPLAANMVGDIGKQQQDAALADVVSNKNLAAVATANGDTQGAANYLALADQAQVNADSWGDNGSNRLALHAATEALIGGIAGGGSGALASAGGVVGGNLGQQLGLTLGTAEADKQGLTGAARDAFINTY